METATLDDASFNTLVPNLPDNEVLALLKRLYRKTGTLRSLSSERDQNFRFDSDCGSRFVVKIGNPSEEHSVIGFQVKALRHLSSTPVEGIVPKVIPTVTGKAFEVITLPNNAKATIRMLTYLEGTQVKETVNTPTQRRALGHSLAELDLALADFSHPHATHSLIWNVSAADKLAWMLDDIAPTKDKSLVDLFMTRFTDQVLPRLNSLRKQVIHNDFHLYNILVDPADSDSVSGIIDFGDMLYAPLVGEVATAAAFHMTDSSNPFEKASEFVAAYNEKLPLTDMEKEIVTDLVITRQLITVIISEWRSKRFPENKAYILRHNKAAWDALKHAADMPRHIARDNLLNHC
ncbi:MAG: phosphotransferase [Gammaproteobacteria bacterium]|nr:phosphotransferase [Gammaproteobacteria bacterium]